MRRSTADLFGKLGSILVIASLLIGVFVSIGEHIMADAWIDDDRDEFDDWQRNIAFLDSFGPYLLWSGIGFILYAIFGYSTILLRVQTKKRRPRPAPPGPREKTCHECEKPLRFIEEYDSWYCDTCEEYR